MEAQIAIFDNVCQCDRTSPSSCTCEVALLHDSFHMCPLQLSCRLHAQAVTVQAVTVLTLPAGSWVTAYAHIVTAVIGSGVLSLAWSMSWLGRLPP